MRPLSFARPSNREKPVTRAFCAFSPSVQKTRVIYGTTRPLSPQRRPSLSRPPLAGASRIPLPAHQPLQTRTRLIRVTCRNLKRITATARLLRVRCWSPKPEIPTALRMERTINSSYCRRPSGSGPYTTQALDSHLLSTPCRISRRPLSAPLLIPPSPPNRPSFDTPPLITPLTHRAHCPPLPCLKVVHSRRPTLYTWRTKPPPPSSIPPPPPPTRSRRRTWALPATMVSGVTNCRHPARSATASTYARSVSLRQGFIVRVCGNIHRRQLALPVPVRLLQSL